METLNYIYVGTNIYPYIKKIIVTFRYNMKNALFNIWL